MQKVANGNPLIGKMVQMKIDEDMKSLH